MNMEINFNLPVYDPNKKMDYIEDKNYDKANVISEIHQYVNQQELTPNKMAELCQLNEEDAHFFFTGKLVTDKFHLRKLLSIRDKLQKESLK